MTRAQFFPARLAKAIHTHSPTEISENTTPTPNETATSVSSSLWVNTPSVVSAISSRSDGSCRKPISVLRTVSTAPASMR
ncbi:hypothetical protein FOH10_21060 [Nocardia otitidiscaviarum]|uniref:Uncharacterized protein n=1 Tax=Nocardia otitidiscaviarum TaxID=1823 RepID=A0A516NPJ5_9NOCA|nr:hypothetical protein FOH10_21060 [Nocardia otitidiscaviarum]